jgi:hypothetical protein
MIQHDRGQMAMAREIPISTGAFWQHDLLATVADRIPTADSRMVVTSFRGQVPEMSELFLAICLKLERVTRRCFHAARIVSGSDRFIQSPHRPAQSLGVTVMPASLRQSQPQRPS